MKYIKSFESIRDEYPGMFEPRKPEDEPQSVPGFESGTIDPDDDVVYGDIYGAVSEAEEYKTFIKVTKERNFIETKDEIKINLKRLYHDFMMSIFNCNKHYRKFLNDELICKYVSDGFTNMFDDEKLGDYKGIIEKIYIMFDGDSAFVNFDLKGHEKSEDTTFCENIITIDKVKSMASKYNI